MNSFGIRPIRLIETLSEEKPEKLFMLKFILFNGIFLFLLFFFFRNLGTTYKRGNNSSRMAIIFFFEMTNVNFARMIFEIAHFWVPFRTSNFFLSESLARFSEISVKKYQFVDNFLLNQAM